MFTPPTIEYPWPVLESSPSVSHFYTHNRVQHDAHAALGAALVEVYGRFAHFDASRGSSFAITPEELASAVTARVHAAIVEAARVEDPALVQNEAHELVISRRAREETANV